MEQIENANLDALRVRYLIVAYALDDWLTAIEGHENDRDVRDQAVAILALVNTVERKLNVRFDELVATDGGSRRGG